MHRYLIALFVALALLLPGPVDAHRRRSSRAPTMAPTPDRLAALAQCESGGNPRAVSHSGRYFGLYQFSLPTWRSMPERGGWPHTHTVEEQTDSARQLVLRTGWRSQFPSCSRRLGFR